MAQQYKALTSEQVDFFMENGYVVIKQAFTREQAADFTREMWVRLGMEPNDKSTWNQERIHMPVTKRVRVSEFAPKAWEAITDLCGGEDRINVEASTWGDSFIVNLGTPELEGAKPREALELDNWHVDGDFFVHFIDSPEQALLVIPLFSSIAPGGGATFIATDGIDIIAKYLAAHPEGVIPEDRTFRPAYLQGTADQFRDYPGFWSHLEEIKRCEKFVELTGETGDVVLMHPLMMHSASKNVLRVPRVITNPPVSVRKPFNFNRDDPNEYSLVERKTLKALGVDRLDFKPTTERREVVPKRVMIQRAMLEVEKKRLEEMRLKSAQASPASQPVPVAVA
ncbi:uncharacterized protein PHACADRAFT_246402 [Phanerochaete carnosa HHB-10118-sp]|uniref:Phytanoyl-CoA dioxygenase n=1 Tax=Phanerochaete carnosa (strain HHB-10118-sp) TaxID=650164 RepID=K5WMN3_PHACS|nr:uncharacterized protein PHACADRAFT_246402 [Phanerochaete carnosa HHB-10118-sp]EKM60449.1 hypothetical protein PHACADRAFT_246402 [Phanerochaete carnosa HHB-10118-sp]